MRKNKLLLLLALLMTAATGAWAQTTYTIKFEANGNSKTVENVTLPHTFLCDYSGENGELDQIIKQLYGLSGGCCSQLSPGASGNSNVTAGMNGDNQFITISAPFEGNATVTGYYFDAAYSDFDYSLTISCPGYTPAGYTVSLKDGVKDADKWTVKVGEGQAQALPIGGLKGDGSETVTLTYTGRLKVKGVKATSDAAAPSVPDGAIGGKFSVSESKQVYFSKGNLRYASSKWSFFDNQYDYYTSYSADAWDHFGWSTSATDYGMNTSTSSGDYSGDFVDWGAAMGDGWRTLTSDEWTYLLNTRSASTVGGTENGRYAKAKVNDVQGVILFPDTYTHPDGVTAPTGVNATGNTGWNGNSYTAEDWTKMESAGCVFLPAAGNRSGSSVNNPGSLGFYWSATPNDTGYAYDVVFNSSTLNPANSYSRSLGFSVRLVQEATSDAAAAAGKALSEATAEDLGKVAGQDGYIYDNVEAATAAGTTASAIIAYVGTAGSVDESSSTYKGLAIALTDANSGVTYQWCSEIGNTCVSQTSAVATAITYMDGIASTNILTDDGHTHAAATAASSYGTDRPSGVSAWFLPSMGQWNLIVQGLATKQAGSTVSTDLTTFSNSTYMADNLNSVITAAGGTGFQSSYYWSSTEFKISHAWDVDFGNGYADYYYKTNITYVRSVFAF